jgi:transposase
MVVLGVDPHKQSYTVVAVEETGRQLAQLTVSARTDGQLRLLGWARQLPIPDGVQRRWAVEDGRQVAGRLVAELLRAGEQVVWVPPKLMANARTSARTRGESDPIDALVVARAALREPGLAAAQLQGPALAVRLVADHREDLVAERTRMLNRLRWHLHDLDPELALVAIARSILVIVWHLLADPTARFHDLGADYYASRIDRDRKTRNLIHQLQALGHKVTLEPAA